VKNIVIVQLIVHVDFRVVPVKDRVYLIIVYVVRKVENVIQIYVIIVEHHYYLINLILQLNCKLGLSRSGHFFSNDLDFGLVQLKFFLIVPAIVSINRLWCCFLGYRPRHTPRSEKVISSSCHSHRPSPAYL
jgi:hypothetical protein